MKNYLISGSSATLACTKIENPKPNCMVHLSKDVCSQCDMNYYLAEDKTCKAFPTDCLSYSLTECKSCASGYIMNKNWYRKNLDKFDTSAAKEQWWMTLY